MRIGSLFSGYGGLDLGVQQVFGGDVAWHVEFDTAPSKILAHHWPDVPNYGDVRSVDWVSVEPVDILAGGFPCQDVSLAGRRAGLTDGTRSGLWSEYARAIDILRPEMVVIENVRGLLSAEAAGAVEPDPWGMGDGSTRPTLNAFGVVLGDLASLGYDARWVGVRAADAGAPHGRFRVFIIANPTDDDGRRRAGARGSSRRPTEPRPGVTPKGGDSWGVYAPAVEHWERISGRAAPAATRGDGKEGAQRLSPVFVEWMMGLPEGHVTDPAIGLTRNEQLKALGNGVVPQQAALALRLILGSERFQGAN